ncbi:MAG: hypothetical protein ABFD12_14605 [Syntrophorhabdus sp.]
MSFKFPACKKEWPNSKQVARHMFGTGDKAHRGCIESQGYSYIELLLAQTTEPGNKSYEILSELIEKAQDKL